MENFVLTFLLMLRQTSFLKWPVIIYVHRNYSDLRIQGVYVGVDNANNGLKAMHILTDLGMISINFRE